MPLVRALLEPRPCNKWRAHFYVTEPKPAALGETEGSWAHCIGELLKLREGMAAARAGTPPALPLVDKLTFSNTAHKTAFRERVSLRFWSDPGSRWSHPTMTRCSMRLRRPSAVLSEVALGPQERTSVRVSLKSWNRPFRNESSALSR